MKYIPREVIYKSIKKYLPMNTEMIHSASIWYWLAENVFDHSPRLRRDYCHAVVQRLEKEGFFLVTRSATNTKIYTRIK